MSTPSKLIIKSYAKPDFSGYVGTYNVRVNPNKYERSFEVKYDQQPAAGGANVPLKFHYMPPSKVDFELLFDATGAIPNSSKDLTTEIDDFLAVVYNYQGNIHEPAYLKLYWGTMVFGARLTSLSFSYTLFRQDGTPLRATARASFSDYIDPATLAKKEDKQSADLTHVVTVKEGETLPLLCYRIYGDSTFYPQVARANGLVHFRRLKPGTRLLFPPLQ